MKRTLISILAAVVIIGLSVALKYKTSEHGQAKGAATLVVEQIIRDSIQSINEIEKTSDFLASTSVDQVAVPTNDNGPEPTYTATDRFSQEIFREYIAAKQAGQDVNTDISSQIAEKVLSQDYSDKKPLYSVLDMKLSTDSSVSALKTYGNTLGLIFSTPPAASENELQIFQKITAEPVEKYQKELLAIQKRYKSMVSKLVALPAPQAFMRAQVDIANSISIFIDAIDGALAVDSDPIGALGKIARHDEGMSTLRSALASVKKTFTAKGVGFSSKESGFILTE